MKHLVRIALLIGAFIAIGAVPATSAAAGANCSFGVTDIYWDGALTFQATAFCTVSPPSSKVDKVQFITPAGLVDHGTVHDSVGLTHNAFGNYGVVTVSANGTASILIRTNPWCPAQTAHWVHGFFSIKIHRWYTNTWGTPVSPQGPTQSIWC